jgi:TonB family protein
MAEREIVMSARRAVSGWIRLSISGTGRLQSANLMASTSYPAIDSAILAMIHRADSAGAIPPPPSTTNDTAFIDLSIEEGGSHSTTLTRFGPAEVAMWVPESQPSLVHAGPVRYPEALRSRQIGGRLVFEFVVGADGVPIPSTIHVRSATDPAFAAASLALVQGSRYRPATLRGCTIPMLVQQGINFTP